MGFFLKEKSDLANIMIVSIKNLKNKYNATTMYEKTLPPKKPVNRKGWELTSGIQPQVCHNRMAALKENSTGYMHAQQK